MPPLPPVKAFISHSIKNKKIAMAFRTVLKKYGIMAFVSGKDIKGGQPWQKTIRKEIDDMDIFIAIHTQAFSKSLWCQQETGMALKRENKIEIIPINVGMRNAPESFLTNFQYIKTRGKSTEEVVREFFETLKESEKTKKLYLKRIEPKVKQVDKDAKEAIDKAWTKRINSPKNKINKRLPNATVAGLISRHGSVVGLGGTVSNHGSAAGSLVSRHASGHSSAYRKKAKQPRLPVTYPDELL